MFMDTKERDSIIQLKILNEIADIESFSEAYIEATKEIPWKAIRGMRNIAAHHYEAIRIPNVWLTIQEDIPALRQVLLRQHGV